MKVVIFCGGRGTRLSEKTDLIPKPLIKLRDGNPILWHIMKIYSYYGFNDFVLCLGYKGSLIQDYFSDSNKFNIEFVDTGLETGTAGRLKLVENFLDDEFFLTYGDGLSDVNISNLLDHHRDNGKIATVTAVRPLVRFGMLEIEGNFVRTFTKRTEFMQNWIDGGFFVLNKRIFEYLENIDLDEMLEGKIIDNLARVNELVAFKHTKYWKCIDTYRDLSQVNEDISNGSDNWRVW